MRFLRWAWLLAAWAGAGSAMAAAQSAEDFLHGGSAKYIQGRLQEAGVDVEEGLRRYPGDSRLKALADQIRKMKDQKKQDQGGQDSQGGDGDKDKQDKQDSSGQGQQGDQDKKDPEKDGEKKEPESKEEEKDGQGGDKPEPQEGEEGDSTGQDAPPAKPGQMTKEEAERLLNSYQDDEKREQKQQRQKQRGPAEVEEDW